MADKQSWRVSLSIAAVGILGALLGSGFSHYLALKRERNVTFEKRQSEAYVAFVSAFDKYRMSEQARDEGRKNDALDLMKQYELEAGAAVRRIVIFGDKQVVEALAGWYRRESLRPCEEFMKPELTTWEKMRNAALGEGQEVSLSELAAVAGRSTLAVKP